MLEEKDGQKEVSEGAATKDLYATAPAPRVPLPQNLVGYTPMSNTANEMCAGCWFYSGENECQIVSGFPQRIVATGWCDKFLSDRDIIMQIPELAEMVSKELSLLQKAKQLLNKPQPVTERGVFKALGDGKWLAAYSNDFKDKENEIIERAGHDRFVKRLKAGYVPMPELWVWHTKGTRIGQAIDIDRYGHIVVAVGTFDATPIAKEAEKNLIQTGTDDITLSHGFKYPLWAFKNGVYSDLNTFEITLLERGLEANPYTAFDIVVKENTMPVPETKVPFFKRIFGEKADEVISLINGSETRGKELEAMGTAYKETPDLTPPKQTSDETTKDAGEEDKLLTELIVDFATEVEALHGLVKSQDAKIQSLTKDLQTKSADMVKQIQAATSELTEAAKALKAEQGLAPKSVQNGGGDVIALDPDSDAAKDINAALDGQANGSDTDLERAKRFASLKL